VSVLHMTQTMSEGTQITADMVETVSVPENLVENGMSELSSTVGKYAAANLYAGDYLTTEKLTATLAELNLFSAGTDKGKMVVSVTLPSLASGVSGRLLPGDIVSVIAIRRAPSIKRWASSRRAVKKRLSLARISIRR
jgi:pilus assembly protein CpaB